jgi:hypothetical protein
MAIRWIVGVAPRGFSFPLNSRTTVWAPQSARGIATDPDRRARGNAVLGLLRPSAPWDSARAEMNVMAARLAKEYPDNEGFGVAIVPMRDGLTGGLRTPLLALLGALGMVMLLVCVNIANLQMVKLEARRRELAVRGALGASRGWLIRHARGARGSGRGRRCAAATRRNPDVTTTGECGRAGSSALNLGEAPAAASERRPPSRYRLGVRPSNA